MTAGTGGVTDRDHSPLPTRAGLTSLEDMSPQVVFVHGIRTSQTMWRAQVEHVASLGVTGVAVDLPGHGRRRDETFTLDAALATIDDAVREAATRGPVLLVGHSMGGLLATAYAGSHPRPPLAGLIAASCTSLPRGFGLKAYRGVLKVVDQLPGRGLFLTRMALTATLPAHTRGDFAAGGYALDAQDAALASLAGLDLPSAVRRLEVPAWFVNGQFDQLRLHERLFRRLAPSAQFLVVPRASHLVTAMRPDTFNAVLTDALTALALAEAPSRSDAA